MKERKKDEGGAETQTVIAPDGGWGWVIVFAVFTGNCLMDGCVGSYGIFYPELLRTFEAGPVVTSMAGSLLPAVHMCTSPLVGRLDVKFGSRPVCFVGACIGAIGLILASMSCNMTMFMITFGVILGVGISMNFLPGQVITNNYFDKKRGIAGGIVCSGAGFGIFILAPVLQILVTEYGWRGAMLLTAGLYMQLCACSILLRPLYKPKKPPKKSGSLDEIHEKDPMLAKNYPKEVLEIDETFSNITTTDTKEQHKNMTNGFVHGFYTPLSRLTNTDRSISYDVLVTSQKRQLSAKTCDIKQITQSLHHIPVNNNEKLESFIRTSQFLDPVAVLSRSQDFSNDSDQCNEHKFTYNQAKNKTSCFCRTALCDKDIIGNKTFILLLIGGVLIQMGQFIPNMFLPEYCFSVGLDGTQMSIVMALYGAINILGRLSAGCLANIRHVDALWLCNLGMFMCGVGCLVFSLCTTFESLCAFSIWMGYFIGYFPPLQIIVMVECLGVERLTSSLALMQMAKGPAALVGPPLAGLVYQYTQDYAMSIGFAAILFLLSAGIQSMVPISKICSKNSGQRQRDTDLEIIVN